jgi:hypothetical protein
VWDVAGSYKAQHLLEWVSEVLLLEDQLAYEYWVIMFPLVWGSLSDKKDNQIFLAKPVIQLLSQEYHHQQADKRPNVIPVGFSATCLCMKFCVNSSSFSPCSYSALVSISIPASRPQIWSALLQLP